MRRYRADDLPTELGEEVLLSEQASHHLLVVCRHPRNAPLVLFDGEGREVEGVLTGVVQGRATIRSTTMTRCASPQRDVHLVLGIPKGPALDHALRMAVEVGSTHIHLATTERSVRRDDRSLRWTRIVVSACQQCGRADQPELYPLSPLREAAASLPTEIQRFVGVPRAPFKAPSPGPVALAIGPEGGFSQPELQWFWEHGWRPLSLGQWTLRTATAVAVGLATVQGAPNANPTTW